MTHTKQSLIAALEARREKATGHRRLALNEALSLANQLDENVGVDGDLVARLEAIPVKTFLRLPTGSPLISAEVLIGELCHEAARALKRPQKLTFLDDESVVEEVKYKQDRLYDSAYIAGLKHGYNLGLHENDEELRKCIDCRIKERRSSKRLAQSSTATIATTTGDGE